MRVALDGSNGGPGSNEQGRASGDLQDFRDAPVHETALVGQHAFRLVLAEEAVPVQRHDVASDGDRVGATTLELRRPSGRTVGSCHRRPRGVRR